MRKIYSLIGVLAMSLLSFSCQQQIDVEAAKTELLQVAQQFNKENSEIGYIEGYNKYMAEDVLDLATWCAASYGTGKVLCPDES